MREPALACDAERMRVLIVDDEVRLFRHVVSALTEAGHDPVAIYDGETAFGETAAVPYDLVILPFCGGARARAASRGPDFRSRGAFGAARRLRHRIINTRTDFTEGVDAGTAARLYADRVV